MSNALAENRRDGTKDRRKEPNLAGVDILNPGFLMNVRVGFMSEDFVQQLARYYSNVANVLRGNNGRD